MQGFGCRRLINEHIPTSQTTALSSPCPLPYLYVVRMITTKADPGHFEGMPLVHMRSHGRAKIRDWELRCDVLGF